MDINLPLVLSIIGCTTGVASLLINFYKVLVERTKLDIDFAENQCLYFNKLENYSTYNTTFQSFIYIRLINKSSNPITIYDIQTYCNDERVFHHSYNGSTIELVVLKSSKRTTVKQYDMSKQIKLPLKIDGFSVFQGYIFYDFLPDLHNEIQEFNLTIKTSRKMLKKSCLVNKFETEINTDTK